MNSGTLAISRLCLPFLTHSLEAVHRRQVMSNPVEVSSSPPWKFYTKRFFSSFSRRSRSRTGSPFSLCDRLKAIFIFRDNPDWCTLFRLRDDFTQTATVCSPSENLLKISCRWPRSWFITSWDKVPVGSGTFIPGSIDPAVVASQSFQGRFMVHMLPASCPLQGELFLVLFLSGRSITRKTVVLVSWSGLQCVRPLDLLIFAPSMAPNPSKAHGSKHKFSLISCLNRSHPWMLHSF